MNKHTQTPVNAVWMNCAIGCCLLLLIFGGEVTIGAIFSIGACAAFVAFTTPIFIRVFFVGNRFRAGPWNLGRFSIPIGAVASAFVALMVPILCLPSVTGSDLTPDGMNWTAVVYGGPMFAIIIWWFVSARKWFNGPVVNLEHVMHGRAAQKANILDGQSPSSDDDGAGDQLPGKLEKEKMSNVQEKGL